MFRQSMYGDLKFASAFGPPEVMSLPLAYKPSRSLRRVSDTEVPPFRLICKILGANFGTEREEGTGFLVSHRHVLTAAHVLLDGNAIVTPGQVQIFPGLNDGFIPFESSKAKRIHIFPGYDPGSEVTVEDIALIETEDFLTLNIPEPPFFWGISPNVFDKTGTSVGAIAGWRPGHYKVSVSGYPVESEIQHYSFDYTIKVPRSQLATLPVEKQRSFLFIRNDVRRGMSGSPVWVKRHSSTGGRVAFAVLLGMDEIQGKRYAAARLITDDVIKFIGEYTGQTVRQVK